MQLMNWPIRKGEALSVPAGWLSCFVLHFVPLQKKKYAKQLESMLVTHVFPEFQNSLGYMRARVSGRGHERVWSAILIELRSVK